MYGKRSRSDNGMNEERLTGLTKPTWKRKRLLASAHGYMNLEDLLTPPFSPTHLSAKPFPPEGASPCPEGASPCPEGASSPPTKCPCRANLPPCQFGLLRSLFPPQLFQYSPRISVTAFLPIASSPAHRYSPQGSVLIRCCSDHFDHSQRFICLVNRVYRTAPGEALLVPSLRMLVYFPLSLVKGRSKVKQNRSVGGKLWMLT